MKQFSIIQLLTLITCTQLFAQKNNVQYDTISRYAQYEFKFSDTLNNAFLAQLRTEYALFKLIDNKKQDIDNVLAILNWTHSQWTHDGSNEPSNNDALTILREARDGKNFRCVEYGIVSKTALEALNYKARVIALKTKDVEITKFGAGHVLAEVWMPQFRKWVLIDGQFNVMPILDNIPLNAVEFQQAIAENKNFQLIDMNGEVSKKRRKKYLSFIFDYLYYIDAKFDNRYLPVNEKLTYEGKSSLMLVPLGGNNPKIFQIKYPLDYVIYTNSLKDFYQTPK
jgi:transglutaminase-like putative cysteine protease